MDMSCSLGTFLLPFTPPLSTGDSVAANRSSILHYNIFPLSFKVLHSSPSNYNLPCLRPYHHRVFHPLPVHRGLVLLLIDQYGLLWSQFRLIFCLEVHYQLCHFLCLLFWPNFADSMSWLGSLGTSCLFSWLFTKSTCFLTSPSTNILACLGWLQLHREKLFKVSSFTLKIVSLLLIIIGSLIS